MVNLPFAKWVQSTFIGLVQHEAIYLINIDGMHLSKRPFVQLE